MRLAPDAIRGIVPACIVVVVSTLVVNPRPIRAQQTPPFFTPGECAIAVSGDAECGTLTVLENREKPDGRMVKLAVVILKSTSADPAPDPIVYLEGGPGGSIDLGGAGLAGPFLAERDFILMEQRGNTHSDPWLDCPEHDSAFIHLFTTADPAGQEAKGLLDAAAICRDRLRAEKIDLGQYHTTATAADFADLREVIGFDEWNLYGISYGTRLALTILREHPEGLRSVVVDSVYPPSLRVYEDFPADYDRSLQVVFDACKVDPECSTDYPNFEADYFRAIETLNARPLPVRSLGVDMRFTGDDLRVATYVMLYYPSTIALLPVLTEELNAGRGGMVGPLMDSFGIYLAAISEGKWWSAECYEEIALNDLAVVAAEEKKYPHAPLNFKYRNDFDVCAMWGAGRAPESFKDPVTSDVPVLLMAGQMDASTPPQWAEDAARTLPAGTVIILPGQGHGVSTYGCGQQIALAFVHDPTKPVDTGCAGEASPQEFITGREWIVTTLPYRLADALSVHPSLPAQAAAGLVVAVSLAELLLAPFALLRSIRRKEDAPERLARVTRTLATGTALLGVVMITGLVMALASVIQRNFIYVAVGLLRESWWVLALLPIHALASAALAVLSVISWRRGWWRIVTRAHVTLLAISGVAWGVVIGWAWLG